MQDDDVYRTQQHDLLHLQSAAFAVLAPGLSAWATSGSRCSYGQGSAPPTSPVAAWADVPPCVAASRSPITCEPAGLVGHSSASYGASSALWAAWSGLSADQSWPIYRARIAEP